MDDTRFGERKIGERFEIESGFDWIAGTKISPTEMKKDNGYVIGVSYWTKTRQAKGG